MANSSSMTHLMLPPAPKDVGRLSEVLESALASVGEPVKNGFGLKRVKSAVVIFIDGLGASNLSKNKAYARNILGGDLQTIRCEFPSTTATSITGFATGTRSGQHGIIGYSAYDRKTSEFINLLTGWKDAETAKRRKIVPDFSEKVSVANLEVIGPAAYSDSGFTALTMTGAKYQSANSLDSRFDSALKSLNSSSDSKVIYLYVPELDQLAHQFGVESDKWLAGLEEVDSEIGKFISRLPQGVGVLITADHGVIDVPQEKHIYLDEFDWFTNLVVQTAGDPRCNFIYLEDQELAGDFLNSARRDFGELAYVATPEELVAHGWLVEFSKTAAELLPDFFLIWHRQAVAYDRRFAKKNHLKLIGQHGGISDEETRIPLVKLGSY